MATKKMTGAEYFPWRLRTTRMARERSMAELGEAAGLSRAAVSLYESSARVPSIKAVEQLARELGVSAGWLAFGE